VFWVNSRHRQLPIAMNWGSIRGKGQVRGGLRWGSGASLRWFTLKIWLLRSERVLDSVNIFSGKEGACGNFCANQVPH
jgi:hypothetical protein